MCMWRAQCVELRDFASVQNPPFMEAEWRSFSVVLVRRRSILTNLCKEVAGNYWKCMDLCMHGCICAAKGKKILHIEVTYIWCDRLHELIPLIQKAYQIDKQALNTDSALHLTYKWNISNSVTINANLLPLGWWQREVLRCLMTNPTLSSSSLRGLVRTHFCSACCLLHNRRPEWHFLQGQRYKVICFWMP